jgi:hypothetical protein
MGHLSYSLFTNNPKLRFRALLTEKGGQSLELSRIYRVKEVSKHRNLLSD